MSEKESKDHDLQQLCALTRQVVVRAIHHLENPALSEAENRHLYGHCYRRHGHHYKVQVTIAAPIDETTGLVFDRDRFDEILTRRLVKPFDGADLNEHFENTSCEALTIEFFRLLEGEFPKGVLKKIAIRETLKNHFEFEPAPAPDPEPA